MYLNKMLNNLETQSDSTVSLRTSLLPSMKLKRLILSCPVKVQVDPFYLIAETLPDTKIVLK